MHTQKARACTRTRAFSSFLVIGLTFSMKFPKLSKRDRSTGKRPESRYLWWFVDETVRENVKKNFKNQYTRWDCD
jgi:hypothetical protein